MNYQIILSGGVGSRVKGIDMPKQYYSINGKPIIMYSVEKAIENSDIDGFIIVADTKWHSYIEMYMDKEIEKFMGFVTPGENRQMSIYNGLLFLEGTAHDNDIVIIHDAARPNVTNELVNDCIRKTKDYDGAMPVLPMKDTIYFSKSNEKADYTMDRSKIFAGQAPEAFKYGKYLEAIKSLSRNDILKINGSSEPAILAGMNIAIVEGDENNYKITTIFDLEKFKLEKKDESFCT